MDNEKLFDLMSKMYAEFSEFRKETSTRFDSMEDRFDSVEGKLGSVEKRLDKIEMAIEHDIKNDIKALYDGYQATQKKLTNIETIVLDTNRKVEKHDVEIQLIKSSRI
ncbi:MAG: hypothetical protein MJB12_19920 [Firmicutes bacterium]|nr:hypothetical protein [Bacillota bacterium]